MANEFISRENEDKLGVALNQDTVTLTNISTEYSWTVPNHTKRIVFKLRTLDVAFLYGWASGDLNITVPPGFVRDIADIHLVGRTLYFQCNDAAGKVVEIEYYT